MNQITSRLLSLQDIGYKEFHQKLMPTVNPDTVIGVRTPHIRALAKELFGTEEANKFLNELPHRFYEENNLHACLIEKIRNYDDCITALEQFLPLIDNWATCDMLSPKILKQNLPQLEQQINRWLSSHHTYTVRFAIKLLMTYFLEDFFDKKYVEKICRIRSGEYYVNMMIAWYFATALAKQYDAILPYLAEKRLSEWIHHKTIQKAVESYRISDAKKAELKSLRYRR